MNGNLKLNDLLGLTDAELKKTRIRLNTYNGVTNPIEEYKKKGAKNKSEVKNQRQRIGFN